jgi:hypothetical protein
MVPDVENAFPFQLDTKWLRLLLTCRLARTELEEAIEHVFKENLPAWKPLI